MNPPMNVQLPPMPGSASPTGEAPSFAFTPGAPAAPAPATTAQTYAQPPVPPGLPPMPQQPAPAQYAPQPAPAQYAPQPAPAQYAPQPAPAQYAPQPAPAQYAPQPAPQNPFDAFGGAAPASPTVGPTQADAADFAVRIADAMKAGQQQPQDANQYLVDVPQVEQSILDQYNASLPVIQKVVAETLNSHYAPKLHDMSAQAQQITSTVEQRVGDASDGMYRSMVRSQHQDLDAIVTTPEFQQFKSTPVPYTGGKTVADLLHEAHTSKNATAMVSLLNDFKSGQQGGQPPVTTPQPYAQPSQPQMYANNFNPQVVSHAQPHTAPNAALYPQVAQSGGPGQGLDWQAYRNLSAAYTTGQVSRDQYQQMAAPYEQAIMQADQLGIPLDQLVGPM